MLANKKYETHLGIIITSKNMREREAKKATLYPKARPVNFVFFYRKNDVHGFKFLSGGIWQTKIINKFFSSIAGKFRFGFSKFLIYTLSLTIQVWDRFWGLHKNWLWYGTCETDSLRLKNKLLVNNKKGWDSVYALMFSKKGKKWEIKFLVGDWVGGWESKLVQWTA